MSSGAPGFAPQWPVPMNVRSWVTERGASSSRYGALNLATHVGDRRSHVEANRAQLRGALGLAADPAWLDQVHGARVLDLDVDPVGAADGAVTSRPGVVCAVLTADCLPVLLASRDGHRIGVAHAGWRGLVGGVLPAAVRAFGVPGADVLAWLGPAIGPAAYEVGAEVRDAFLRQSAAHVSYFTPNARGRWQADLYGLARDALTLAGVQSIYGGGYCTFSETSRFFSHRREAPCGRMATLIWLAGGAAQFRGG